MRFSTKAMFEKGMGTGGGGGWIISYSITCIHFTINYSAKKRDGEFA